MISFIYISNRPRGLDLLAESFIPSTTQTGWELIVVDGHPGRVGRGRGERYLREQAIPVGFYGEPKPKTFSHSRTGFTNAMNTGLLHARGEWVVFVHDYTILPRNAVQAWMNAIERSDKNTLIHGAASVYKTPRMPDHPDEEIHTWATRPPLTFGEFWRPKVFEVGYWCAPMEFFESCNGIDERADFCSEWALNCVMAQAKYHGYKLAVDVTLNCLQIDHRAWSNAAKGLDTLYKTWGFAPDNFPEPAWTGWSANPYRLDFERGRNLIESK